MSLLQQEIFELKGTCYFSGWKRDGSRICGCKGTCFRDAVGEIQVSGVTKDFSSRSSLRMGSSEFMATMCYCRFSLFLLFFMRCR